MQNDSHQPERSDYVDFELEIGIGHGREYPISVLDSPAGEARATMQFPYDELVLENRLLTLQNALLRSGGEPRRTLSPEAKRVQDFGRELFEALFTAEVRSCYDVSLREAAQQKKGLRLKLRIQSPELAVLPWEYLYHPGQAEHIGLSTRTPVVRYLEVPRRIEPLAVTPPLRILGLIASPKDLPSLDIEREKQRIENAVGDLRTRGLVDLEWLSGQSWRDLQRAMRQGPWHIFHFVGHGGFDRNTGEGLVALADSEGLTTHFSATQLGRLLADHASLRLVLLNSCEGARGSERDIFSSTASILVRRGIPAVVAMQYEITDRAAIEFARTFYEALGDGMPVDGAMAEARKAISFAVTNTVEWGTPVLYMRSSDGVLFQISEARRAERLPPLVPGPPPTVDRELEQREWAQLYNQALAAQQANDWSSALPALEKLVADAPDYKDAAALLDVVKKQKKLADLNTQARQLHGAKRWEAVVNTFAQIAALEPEFGDPEGLLASAERQILQDRRHREQQEQVERQRQQQTAKLYQEAQGLARAGHWRQALAKMKEIQGLDLQFADPQGIAARAQAEADREEAEVQRQSEVAALYAEAVRLLRAGKYQAALNKWDEVRAQAPQYPDRNNVQVTARQRLAASVKPAPSKRKPARPARQTVQPRRAPLPAWFWPLAGGAAVLLLVLVGLIVVALDREDVEPVTPSVTSPALAQATSAETPADKPTEAPVPTPTDSSSPATASTPPEPQQETVTALESYRITITTGQVAFAGTDAKIYISLYGKGNVSTEELSLPNDGTTFEIGTVDTFTVSARKVGVLERIRLRHDNSGFGPGWYVEKIRIVSETEGGSWDFIDIGWLDTDEAPYQIDRMLTPEP